MVDINTTIFKYFTQMYAKMSSNYQIDVQCNKLYIHQIKFVTNMKQNLQ